MMKTYKDGKGIVRAVKCGCNRSFWQLVEDRDSGITFLPRGKDDFCFACNNFFYYTRRKAHVHTR